MPLFQDIMEYGNLKPALSELKSVLNTPIKAYSPADCIGSTHFKKTKSTGKQSEDSDPSAKGSAEVREVKEVELGKEESRESRAATMGTVSEADSIPEGDLPGQMTRVLGKRESDW